MRNVEAIVSKKNLSLLGHELLKRYPNIASEILTDIIASTSGYITDTSLVNYYFDAFCDYTNQDSGRIRNTKNNYSVTETKRIFVGFVIKIYHPNLFKIRTGFFQPQIGLIKNLSSTLNMDEGNISRLIRQVIVRIRVYNDFAEYIEKIYNDLIYVENAN